MLLRERRYARPDSVEEALRLLGDHEDAQPLACGQPLINVTKMRVASPDVLVDLSELRASAGIRLGADGGLELGAMATTTRSSARRGKRSRSASTRRRAFTRRQTRGGTWQRSVWPARSEGKRKGTRGA
jgi:CO/xanthine dehydrogenase FAD-binding subunit